MMLLLLKKVLSIQIVYFYIDKQLYLFEIKYNYKGTNEIHSYKLKTPFEY